MIWLSKMHEQAHVSYYFSPQSISLTSCAGVSSGVIEGVFGDGADEVLTEVSLGGDEFVRFLPVWNESDGATIFPRQGDDQTLGALLLDEIKRRVDLDAVLLKGEQQLSSDLLAPQRPSSACVLAA
ncbi:MAG: hypothetical protein R6V33_09955 [Pelovirga sp.]